MQSRRMQNSDAKYRKLVISIYIDNLRPYNDIYRYFFSISLEINSVTVCVLTRVICAHPAYTSETISPWALPEHFPRGVGGGKWAKIVQRQWCTTKNAAGVFQRRHKLTKTGRGGIGKKCYFC